MGYTSLKMKGVHFFSDDSPALHPPGINQRPDRRGQP